MVTGNSSRDFIISELKTPRSGNALVNPDGNVQPRLIHLLLGMELAEKSGGKITPNIKVVPL